MRCLILLASCLVLAECQFRFNLGDIFGRPNRNQENQNQNQNNGGRVDAGAILGGLLGAVTNPNRNQNNQNQNPGNNILGGIVNAVVSEAIENTDVNIGLDNNGQLQVAVLPKDQEKENVNSGGSTDDLGVDNGPNQERQTPKHIYQCSTDSDCPIEDLPIPDDDENGREMYRCMYDYEREDGTKICCDEKCQIDTEKQVYGDLPIWNDDYYEERGIKVSHCLYDYERDDGSKRCYERNVPFCAHPEARSHEKCQIGIEEQLYELNEGGQILCQTDSDCPPTTAPEWDGWSPITGLTVEESYCSKSNFPPSPSTSVSSPTNGVCKLGDAELFCNHKLGRDHPECKRCNVVYPLPDPPCLKYDGTSLFILDDCCHFIFNNTGNHPWYHPFFSSEDLRKEIQRNFTMNDCQLSGLHQPPDSPPRTSFDNSICCDAPFTSCISGVSSASALTRQSLSAVAGIQDLAETSLANRTPSWTCPSFFCKQQSLARPGTVICCPLTRRLWGNTRVLVCPRSCD
jgi:hypothetical protein